AMSSRESTSPIIGPRCRRWPDTGATSTSGRPDSWSGGASTDHRHASDAIVQRFGIRGHGPCARSDMHRFLPLGAGMSALCRILLVEETADEWRAALSSLSESGLMNQTTVVNGHGEALDYLYARGAFRRRPSGLPAVVVMGPSLQW